MRKSKFNITAMIAIIACFALAASLLAGCSGKDGVTPHIGENGNWWIGDEDTGVKVTGQSGTDGKNGIDNTVSTRLGENGNWWIGDVDTGVKATGQNIEEAEYVTPEMFGAVGNGKTNDTTAVQSALNTGKPVFLCNTYKVKELDCTGLEKIVMYGKEDVASRLSTFPVANDAYNIIFEGTELFKNAPGNISLQEIRFLSKNKGALITTQLSGAWVQKCNFTNFGGVFLGGMKAQSQITENVFFQLYGTFATDCADSIVSNNYINGNVTKHLTLFTGTNFTGMVFEGNFVDYFKIAFGEYINWEYNRVVDNIFDSIFRAFDTKHAFNDTTVTGNHFSRVDYEVANADDGWQGFASRDTEMKNQEWRVFTFTGTCNRVNISGNSGKAVAALKMDVNNPTDTYIDVSGIKGKIEFKYCNTSSTDVNSTIFVKNLDYITVNSLPSAALYNTSGATLTSFNNQHVFYQGNLYVNNNGAWLQLTNNG